MHEQYARTAPRDRPGQSVELSSRVMTCARRVRRIEEHDRPAEAVRRMELSRDGPWVFFDRNASTSSVVRAATQWSKGTSQRRSEWPLVPPRESPPPCRRTSGRSRSAYIWTSQTPLDTFPAVEVLPVPNQLAENFAIRAIEAQPLGYAKAVLDDTWRAFGCSG